MGNPLPLVCVMIVVLVNVLIVMVMVTPLWVVRVLLAMVVRVRSGDTETIAGGCHLVETGDGISR